RAIWPAHYPVGLAARCMPWYITRNSLTGKFGDRNGHRFAGVWPAPVGWKSRGGRKFLVGAIPPSPASGRGLSAKFAHSCILRLPSRPPRDGASSLYRL